MTVSGTVKVALALAIILALAWGIFQMNSLRASDAQQVTKAELAVQNERQKEVITELRVEGVKARAALREAIEQIENDSPILPVLPGAQFIPVPGEDGSDGLAGPQGETGPRGPIGPMPLLSDVLGYIQQAVTDFCAGGNCRGPKGDSVQGDDGRGIARVECNDDDLFVIHYDDDTEQIVENSRCRILLLP